MTHRLPSPWLLAAALLLTACCARPRCAPPCPSPRAAEPALTSSGPAPSDAAPSSPERAVLLEATYFAIPAAKAESVLGSERGTSPRWMALLTAEEAARLQRLAKEADAAVLANPSVVTTSGQEVTVFVGESYDEEPHRPAKGDPYEAALRDPHWSGREFHALPTVLPEAGFLSLDFAFIRHDPPPAGTKPDPSALLAGQQHGRMGIARMASGTSAAICVAAGTPKAPGERTLLLVTPRVLPPSSRAPRR